MPALTVHMHRLAAKDYLGALRWYLQRSNYAANLFAREMTRAIERIRDNPCQWPALDSVHRFTRVSRFPFVLYYRVLSETEVLILAVAHSQRRPGYWRRRKP